MHSKHLLRKGILIVLFSSLMAACSVQQPELEPLVLSQTTVVVPASIPPGVVRYCWEEPIVEFEPNGPGLDPEGKWYHPSYLAVREVRSGKWRPCRPVADEIKGEIADER